MLWKQLSPGYRKLLRSGAQGEAVVVEAKKETSRSDVVGVFGWTVTIRVKFADGTSADFERYIEAAHADDVDPGMVVPIRFDPDKRSKVEIDTEALDARRAQRASAAHAAQDAAVARAESQIKPLGE